LFVVLATEPLEKEEKAKKDNPELNMYKIKTTIKFFLGINPF
jgi:hypothetical protein